MKYTTRFAIGDDVWFISDNSIKKASVTYIKISLAIIVCGVRGYTPSHHNYELMERRLFATKQETLDSL